MEISASIWALEKILNMLKAYKAYISMIWYHDPIILDDPGDAGSPIRVGPIYKSYELVILQVCGCPMRRIPALISTKREPAIPILRCRIRGWLEAIELIKPTDSGVASPASGML
jgi:hypothetical protein